jgi:hypothetical protein
MSELAALLERFRKGADVLESAVRDVTAEEWDYVPASGRWTIRQVVAHVTDGEIVGADRFRRVIAEENPTLVNYDEQAWAERLDYARRHPLQDLELFRRTRALSASLLASLPEPVFARAGTHSTRGPMSLQDLLVDYANHPEGHARQIEKNREAFRKARAEKVYSKGDRTGL